MDSWLKDMALNSNHHKKYIEYQSRYLNNPRKSDLEIIKICKEIYEAHGSNLKLLDIGCSQGNLLHLIKTTLPDWNLFGGDVSSVEIEECEKQSRLNGISFKVMDIFNLPTNCFDVIIVNAVLFLFDHNEAKKSLESISNSLRAGGSAILFDLLNVYPQNLKIIEENLLEFDLRFITLNIRNIKFFESQVQNSGLNLKKALPFYIDIDLSNDENSIVTHTKIIDGSRHSFRGSLYQPWHHIVLSKN